MVRLAEISALFTRPFRNWDKVEYFRRVLYWFLIANTLSLLPAAHEIWAYDGLVGTRGWFTDLGLFEQGSYGWLNLLSHPANSKYEWVYILFIVFQLLFLLTGLLRVLPVFSSVMVYFFTVNLFHKGYLAFTGGEVIINLLLFYLIFIQCNRSHKGIGGLLRRQNGSPEFTFLQNLFNTTFYVLMLIQICVVYFASSLFKLMDETWVNGDAIMFISRIDVYSCYVFEWMFSDSPTLSWIATWSALAYQMLFPVLVWVRRIKVPYLILGTLFHLGIAFGMGIFSFGIIMILCYVLFLDEHQIAKLRNFLRLRRT